MPAKKCFRRRSHLNLSIPVLSFSSDGLFFCIQNLRPRPSSLPIPCGGVEFMQRLWYEVLVSLLKYCGFDISRSIRVTFCFLVSLGLGIKP